MKTKEDLEEAIKDILKKYKEIIFWLRYTRLYGVPGWTSKAAGHRLKSVWSKVDGWYGEETRLEGASKNIAMDGDMMIDRRTGEVLDPAVESTYWKDKF